MLSYWDSTICVNFVLCNYTLITINHNLCLLSRIDIHYTQNFRISRLQEFVYLEIARISYPILYMIKSLIAISLHKLIRIIFEYLHGLIYNWICDIIFEGAICNVVEC